MVTVQILEQVYIECKYKWNLSGSANMCFIHVSVRLPDIQPKPMDIGSSAVCI